MSGRCKACNCIMSDYDMKQQWPESDEYTDLCENCLAIAIDPDSADFDDDDYYPDILFDQHE